MNSRITESRIAGMFHGDELTTAYQSMNEAARWEYIVKASSLPTKRMIDASDNAERIGIMFRDKMKPTAQWAHGGTYYWNAEGDGWFRSMEGISKGYGLIFKNLKLTSKNPLNWDGSIKYQPGGVSQWSIYKATFDWVPNEYTNDLDWDKYYEKSNIWLVIPDDVDPMDAIKVVMKDQRKWIP